MLEHYQNAHFGRKAPRVTPPYLWYVSVLCSLSISNCTILLMFCSCSYMGMKRRKNEHGG